jgi:hypothetical protein
LSPVKRTSNLLKCFEPPSTLRSKRMSPKPHYAATPTHRQDDAMRAAVLSDHALHPEALVEWTSLVVQPWSRTKGGGALHQLTTALPTSNLQLSPRNLQPAMLNWQGGPLALPPKLSHLLLPHVSPSQCH